MLAMKGWIPQQIMVGYNLVKNKCIVLNQHLPCQLKVVVLILADCRAFFLFFPSLLVWGQFGNIKLGCFHNSNFELMGILKCISLILLLGKNRLTTKSYHKFSTFLFICEVSFICSFKEAHFYKCNKCMASLEGIDELFPSVKHHLFGSYGHLFPTTSRQTKNQS